MTLLEILDTSIKIGLGALITGIIAYFNQKANISASLAKDNLTFHRNLLSDISKDIEEINHLVLKIWSIFDFENKQSPIDKKTISDRLYPLKKTLFNDFNLLSKNEGLLLLYGYNQQQEKLRLYGDLLQSFNSYTYYKNEEVNSEQTALYKLKILQSRKDLYESLNKVIPK